MSWPTHSRESNRPIPGPIDLYLSVVQLIPQKRLNLRDAGYALYDQVVASERARFVEAGDVDFTGERNSERLRAVNI